MLNQTLPQFNPKDHDAVQKNAQLNQNCEHKLTACLEKTVNFPGLRVDVDVKITRRGGQAGNSLDVRCKCIPARVTVSHSPDKEV